MFGNCATGKVTVITTPTITVRIAMTIATMGRLIKKLDMGPGSFRSLVVSARSLTGAERLGLNPHAGPDLLLAFDDHTVARFESAGDHPHGFHALANLNLPRRHRVIRADDHYFVTALKLGHRW